MIDRRFEIGTAQFALLGRSTLHDIPRWSTRDFVTNLGDDVGYDGLEWHPTRHMASSREIYDKNIDGRFVNFLLSAHQTYQTQKTLWEAIDSILKKPNQAPLVFVSYWFLVQSHQSVDSISDLQLLLGRHLPVVLYPTEPIDYGDYPFAEKLFQPTKQVMDVWGVRSIEELVEEYTSHGFTGMCFGTTHSRFLGGEDLATNEAALKKILDHTKEVHIRPGTLDMQSLYKKIDPLSDLRELLGDDNESGYPLFIRRISHNWQQGRVITEISTSALEVIHHEQHPSEGVSTQTILDFHKTIIDKLAQCLNHTEI